MIYLYNAILSDDSSQEHLSESIHQTDRLNTYLLGLVYLATLIAAHCQLCSSLADRPSHRPPIKGEEEEVN